MKLKLTSVLILDALNRYIREYDIRHRMGLIQSASDEFDGHYTKEELKDLIVQGLIEVVPYDEIDPEYDDVNLCGHRWSVHLTEKALRHFWPERWNNGKGSAYTGPVPKASVRARQAQVRYMRTLGTGRSSHHGKKVIP